MKEKNQYIDVLKGIACIIVIFLHCPFPGIIGDGVIYGLRFSVPIFFMVSGYFSYNKNEQWVLKKALYIFKMLLFTELFYGLWTFVKLCVIQKFSFQQAYVMIFDDFNIVETILCGSVFNDTLWYLYAIFWTWIIVFVLRKCKIFDKLYILIPIMLCVQIFGRLYVQNVYDISKYVFLFRNALTFGVPFTFLGSWMARHKENIQEKISIRKSVVIVFVGLCTIVAEYILIGQYMDTQISTVIIVIGLFSFAINSKRPLNKLLNGIAYIGGRWYTWIYLTHMFFIDVIDIVYDACNINGNNLMGYVRPVLVCICACASSHLIIVVQRKIKKI